MKVDKKWNEMDGWTSFLLGAGQYCSLSLKHHCTMLGFITIIIIKQLLLHKIILHLLVKHFSFTQHNTKGTATKKTTQLQTSKII